MVTSILPCVVRSLHYHFTSRLLCERWLNAPIPPPKVDSPLAAVAGKQKAVFAGGCFWGTQSVFERVKGVLKTTAGYAGGSATTATYDQVTTGHAESVETCTTLRRLPTGSSFVSSSLWLTIPHSSTAKGRMWEAPYRSAIFYANDEQKRIATAYIQQLDAAKVFHSQSSPRSIH